MNSHGLFKLLKEEVQYLSTGNFVKKQTADSLDIHYPPGSLEYKIQLVAKYNLENFLEIQNKISIDNHEDIDENLLKEFSLCLDNYMDTHAPGQEYLKSYIRIVSTYLTFIVKKPLHPPNMIFSKNQRLIQQHNQYFCPLKNKQLKEKSSLCRYCVCLSTTKK